MYTCGNWIFDPPQQQNFRKRSWKSCDPYKVKGHQSLPSQCVCMWPSVHGIYFLDVFWEACPPLLHSWGWFSSTKPLINLLTQTSWQIHFGYAKIGGISRCLPVEASIVLKKRLQSWYITGHYSTNPNNALIKGKSLKNRHEFLLLDSPSMGNFMAPVNHRADANMYLQIYREERTYVVTILNLSEIFKNVVLYYTDLILFCGYWVQNRLG